MDWYVTLFKKCTSDIIYMAYLKYETLEDGECCGSYGMQCEDYIIELDWVDPSRMEVSVLVL